MSYVLHIWEKPASLPWPASPGSASEMLSRLHEVKQDQSAKFLAFAQQVTARYPSISSALAEGIQQSEWAWSDDAINGECDTAVFSIGIRVDRAPEVVPFVIEQANALGLNVTDEQSGDVALANGVVLKTFAADDNMEAYRRWLAIPKQREIAPVLLQRLTPFMEKHGFKFRKGKQDFRCTFAEGWHEVYLYTADVSDGCEFDVGVKSRFHAVTDLQCSIATPGRSVEDVKNRWTTVVGQRKWMDETGGFIAGGNKEYLVRSNDEIDAVMGHVYTKLETRLLPILEKYKTIRGFDELLNPAPVTDSIFFDSYEIGAKNVITAYLAENPKVAELCDLFHEKTKDSKNYADSVKETQQCIAYVRSQIGR